MLARGTARIWALGAMSGTSLDGVDAALVDTDGETVFGFGDSGYRPYGADEREVLRAALGRWSGEAVVAAGDLVDLAHAELLAGFPAGQIVGYHGQTLAHDPRGRGTLQVGVGNLTWVDPAAAAPEADGALLAFDTGPANAPLNDLMQARRGLAQDAGGALAAEGAVDDGVVTRFLNHAYFWRIPPKSLDRDAWSGLQGEVAGLSDADAAATLTACAAAAVMRGMEHCPQPPSQVLVTGGGRHNATLMAMLSAALDAEVRPVEAVGLDGDMLEAQAFAYLAVRVARGLPTSAPGTTGVRAAVGGGTISQP
jgi:anhydro-N-acetylmuramic acid kinase